MDTRKLLLGIAFLLALAFFIFFLNIVIRDTRSGGQEAGKGRPGLGDSTREAMGGVSAGLMDGKGFMGSFLDMFFRGGEGAGETRSPKPGPEGDRQADQGTAGAGGAPGEGAGEEGADAKQKLRLIRMKDRLSGERRMYGMKNGGAGTGGSTARTRAGYAKPDEAELESEFEAFLRKLRRRAAANAKSSGRRHGGYEGPRNQTSDGDSPILTVDSIDGPKTPTLKLLEKINRDGADSVRMSGDVDFEDGSRDRYGKKFDGNLKDFDIVPIEETTGAMGSREIRAAEDSTPADLKH